MNADDLERVVVIGTSGSGKTTLARDLSRRLDLEHIELDMLHWLPDWQEQTTSVFRAKVEAAVARERWVVDGNYGKVRDLVWPRATTLIWLDYSFARIMARALRRTLRRSLTREPLFAGNRESLWRSFFSRDSILLWVVSSYGRHRSEYARIIASGRYAALRMLVFRHPSATCAFLRELPGRTPSRAGPAL
jgi:adenylate kinase family enzyme